MSPICWAASLMVMLFYILSSMTWIVGNSGIKGGGSMSVLLMLSSVVCGLLTVLILFYLNGYVIKQRSREFGLYSVLGLGKGNLCLLLFWEILFSCIGSLICGILAGAVFSQLMYLLLLNITRLPVDLEIWVPMGRCQYHGLPLPGGLGDRSAAQCDPHLPQRPHRDPPAHLPG